MQIDKLLARVTSGWPVLFLGLLLSGLFLVGISACETGRNSRDKGGTDPSGHLRMQKASGETMGTSYHLSWLSDESRREDQLVVQAAVDSLLRVFNACLSTYDPQSPLSRWNDLAAGEGSSMTFEGACGSWLNRMLEISTYIHGLSQGAFDPTVMPLVRYWGFFQEDPFGGGLAVDSAVVDSLRKQVGLSRIPQPIPLLPQRDGEISQISLRDNWPTQRLAKPLPAELDFNAVAKGYGVDLVAELLEASGIAHYLVEIGGEVRVRGENARGKPWGIAVESPTVSNRSEPDLTSGRTSGRTLQRLVRLKDASMATSGNYRRYWERDGKRYGHTLNPQTGWPEMSDLLSATVTSASCAEADALATACMVLGTQKALDMLENLEGVEGYLLYLDQGGELAALQTSGFDAFADE